MQDTPAHNFLVILGNCNARLGPEDATNRNSKYLADLLTENNLITTNTCFQKRHGKRWTFLDCTSLVMQQLDYILVRKIWCNSVLNAEAYNGFDSLG